MLLRSEATPQDAPFRRDLDAIADTEQAIVLDDALHRAIVHAHGEGVPSGRPLSAQQLFDLLSQSTSGRRTSRARHSRQPPAAASADSLIYRIEAATI